MYIGCKGKELLSGNRMESKATKDKMAKLNYDQQEGDEIRSTKRKIPGQEGTGRNYIYNKDTHQLME